MSRTTDAITEHIPQMYRVDICTYIVASNVVRTNETLRGGRADGARPPRPPPHVLWSTCDFSDRWWTTPFSDGRCLPRCTRAGPASARFAMRIRTCSEPPSFTAVAATSSVRSAEKSSSRWFPGCSGRSSGRSPARRAQLTNWSDWPPPRKSSRCTSSRCAVRAVGTILFSPTSSVLYPPRSNRAGPDRVRANRTVEQRVNDTIASPIQPVGVSACLPQTLPITLEICT